MRDKIFKKCVLQKSRTSNDQKDFKLLVISVTNASKQNFCIFNIPKKGKGGMFMEHASRRDVLEINYCHTGTIGWDMHCEKSVYLKSGNLRDS